MKKLIFTLAFTLAGLSAAAEIRLPEIIGDNMVLQQNTSANIWGWASANATVTVTSSWTSQSLTTASNGNGYWKISIPTPEAGMQPQSLTVSEIPAGEKPAPENISSSVTINNILIGEVWFCSGQSNMEMPLDGFWDCPVEGSAEEIALSGNMTGIRMATVAKTGALEPQTEVKGEWKACSPQTAERFSATAYYFAKMLNGVLGIPVGIINCSWGGSMVEGWLPKVTVSGYSDINSDVQAPADGNWDALTPFIMYNGMILPLKDYTIRGFCWYQGESNVGRHDSYAGRLAEIASEWRRLWGQGELPFYIVEIAPYLYGGDGTAGARLREAQFKAAHEIPNSGIVCTNDLVYPYEDTQIHPSRKADVGKRLAYMALNRAYGYRNIDCEGPAFREMKIEGSQAFIYFDNDRNGFSPWHDITGFEIAGEDRVFHPAEAKVLPGKKCVAVSSSEVPVPVAVRYCFKDFCPGNLTGARCLPAYPFRTDNWQ